MVCGSKVAEAQNDGTHYPLAVLAMASILATLSPLQPISELSARCCSCSNSAVQAEIGQSAFANAKLCHSFAHNNEAFEGVHGIFSVLLDRQDCNVSVTHGSTLKDI